MVHYYCLLRWHGDDLLLNSFFFVVGLKRERLSAVLGVVSGGICLRSCVQFYYSGEVL